MQQDENPEQPVSVSVFLGNSLSEEERKGLYIAPQKPTENVAPLFAIPDSASMSIDEQLQQLNKTPTPEAGELSNGDAKKKAV